MQLHMIPSAISASLVRMSGNFSVCVPVFEKRGDGEGERGIAYDQRASGMRS